MSEKDEACWYILDTRQVVGNCALWWGPERQGYTTELESAGLYTREQSYSEHRDRITDMPVHRDVVRACSVTHVRVELLWKDEKTCERLTAARDARIDARERANEMSEGELRDALEVNPFDADDYEIGVTVLRDEIVTAAKTHKCHDCGGEICKGLRHRNRAESSENGLVAFRWCHDCTKKHMGYPYGMQESSAR